MKRSKPKRKPRVWTKWMLFRSQRPDEILTVEEATWLKGQDRRYGTVWNNDIRLVEIRELPKRAKKRRAKHGS